MGSDVEFAALLESRKKSGLIAALLNLFIPGAGYIYCGRWFLGIIAFFLVVAMIVSSLGLAIVGVIFILVIDGLLCARRYNRKLVDEMISERRRSAEKGRRSQQSIESVGSGWSEYGLVGPNNISSETKRCPFCAEEIQFAAIKCKHCMNDLTG